MKRIDINLIVFNCLNDFFKRPLKVSESDFNDWLSTNHVLETFRANGVSWSLKNIWSFKFFCYRKYFASDMDTYVKKHCAKLAINYYFDCYLNKKKTS